jgi:hypothetical protein
LLNPVEHEYFFEAQQDKLEQAVTNPNGKTQAFYAHLGSARITSEGEHLWKHSDGTEKPFPPAK